MDAWGIEDGYWDIGGNWHDTPDATRRALRVAMGGLPDVEDPPPRSRPVWFVREGTRPTLQRPCDLVLEDGTSLPNLSALPAELPLGYHDLTPDDGGPTTRLIVTPARCHLPAGLRTWAWYVQLYAARSTASWGIGDLADLRTLARWSAGLGAGLLALNPLHAPLPIDGQEPSPYFPSSRLFRSPLYLRVEEVPGFDAGDPKLAGAAAAGRALNDRRLIDRDAVHKLKRDALERLWSGFDGDPDLDRYRAEHGELLHQYGVYAALAEYHGRGWSRWPAGHRRPESPGVQRFVTDRADRVEYHAWVQWLLDRQLARAAVELPLLGDLAVGVDPNGFDGWLWQDVFAPGVRVGAPPDSFNRSGQDWGLPPFVPWRLRASGYEPLALTIRAALRYCGALRLDHVMGLFRLFWIPDGGGPSDGTYVRYPGRELLDIVALESARAQAVIVGEDLGTVEDEVRAELVERGVLSYRLGWFEPQRPERWPAQALGAITTHDLPTVAGVWTGADEGENLRERLEELCRLPADAPVEDVVVAVHERLAAAPCMVVAGTLDDAVGVPERPNVPGTTGADRPNWSLSLPVPLEEILTDPQVLAVAAALDRPAEPVSAPAD
jgi:4-alpha-glucanotransferase